MALAAILPSLPNLTDNNISLHLIPLAWFISVPAPKLYGRYLYYKAKKHDIDMVNPRNHTKEVTEDQAIEAQTRAQILRCEGAMNNGSENIGLFAAAVVAANAAGLDFWTLNFLTLGYLISRVAFNVIYVWQDTFNKSMLRPVAFFAGVSMYFTLFIKAGNVFQKSASRR